MGIADPKWQFQLVRKLRNWFPYVQFIFTTHSPVVIQGASKDAVFYKVYKEEGVTKISEPIQDLGDLMANSLITSPLFGLETALVRSFDKKHTERISDDDYIYDKIHQVVAQKLKDDPTMVNEEEVMEWVKTELEKEIEKENSESAS